MNIFLVLYFDCEKKSKEITAGQRGRNWVLNEKRNLLNLKVFSQKKKENKNEAREGIAS